MMCNVTAVWKLPSGYIWNWSDSSTSPLVYMWKRFWYTYPGVLTYIAVHMFLPWINLVACLFYFLLYCFIYNLYLTSIPYLYRMHFTSNVQEKTLKRVSVSTRMSGNEWKSKLVQSSVAQGRNDNLPAVSRDIHGPDWCRFYHDTDKLLHLFYGRQCVLKAPAPVLRLDTISAPVYDRDFSGITDRRTEDDTKNIRGGEWSM